jgi:hypothetical protein
MSPSDNTQQLRGEAPSRNLRVIHTFVEEN